MSKIRESLQLSAISSQLLQAERRWLTSDSFMVGLVRIELTTSPLSGVRSSQLSYRPSPCKTNWWSWSGSNRRPPECKSGALPAELQPLLIPKIFEADWTRDPGQAGSPQKHFQ